MEKVIFLFCLCFSLQVNGAQDYLYNTYDVSCLYGHQVSNGNPVSCSSDADCAHMYHCKGGHDSSKGRCCRTNNPCCRGKPHTQNDDATVCKKHHGDCPSGYSCRTNYGNQYGVCCPVLQSFEKCPNGQYYENGVPMICPKKGYSECPTEYKCHMGPNNAPGPCCHVDNPCSEGQPYREGGFAVYCGKGQGHVDCPNGYTCQRSTKDRFAVCCPLPKTTTQAPTAEPHPYTTVPPYSVPVCGYGTLLDANHKPVKCKSGGYTCPYGYTCTGEDGYNAGVCCADKPHTNPPPTNPPPTYPPHTNPPYTHHPPPTYPPLSTLSPTHPDFDEVCENGYLLQSPRYPTPCFHGTCPSGFSCKGYATYNAGSGLCCLDNNVCQYGDPYREGGKALPCGIGRMCPSGYYCHKEMVNGDKVAVCCPDAPLTTTTLPAPTTTPPQSCDYGMPYTSNGIPLSCDMMTPCPTGYYCSNGNSTYRKGICCRRKYKSGHFHKKFGFLKDLLGK